MGDSTLPTTLCAPPALGLRGTSKMTLGRLRGAESELEVLLEAKAVAVWRGGDPGSAPASPSTKATLRRVEGVGAAKCSALSSLS